MSQAKSAERVVRDIRRKTRRRFSGSRGEEMKERYWLRVGSGLMAIGLAATLGACGGDSSPMSPSPSNSTATVTITAAGVSPKQISVGINGTVMFINNDSVTRQINSNPFPAHDDCPPINEVGTLAPGQQRATGPLTFQGACGFHEHLSEGAEAFMGVILVNTTNSDTPPSGY